MENSAFSAFPDTSLFSEGHISYSFKIRAPIEDEQTDPPSETSTESYFNPTDGLRTSPVSTPTKHPTPDTTRRDSGFFGPVTEAQTPLEAKALPSKGETADEYRRWDEKGRKWLYGYVWFQQRKDQSIVRGYMQVSFSLKKGMVPGACSACQSQSRASSQRSIVILSHLAYPALFDAVLEKVAPIYFSHGYPALEAACHGIAGWYVFHQHRRTSLKLTLYVLPVLIRPEPVPGATLELPLLSEVLYVELPELNEAAQMHSQRTNHKTQEALVRSAHMRIRWHPLMSVYLQRFWRRSPLSLRSGFLRSSYQACGIYGNALF